MHEPTQSPTLRITAVVEWVGLALILTVATYLRLSHLDLLQFQSDETIAAHLALRFVRGGELPLAGLMSSVGVTNPPLFIYLLIPLFAVSSNPVVICSFIAVLGLVAVVVCWHIGRTYYNPAVGLMAAAMFAVSPWAVIHTRVIWAQDLVPVFSTFTMWAIHALVLGKRTQAIFWAVLLPLCVVQIHFSGLALTAAVIVILVLLRPRINWRWATGGLAVAGLVLLPYLRFQAQQNWADFKRAAQTVGRQKFQIPPGITVHPEFGYRLPRRESWISAMAIMNAGNIEDVLGLSTSGKHDPYGIWPKTGQDHRYFADNLTMGDWALAVQRIAFVVALAILAVLIGKAVRLSRRLPFVSVTPDPVVQSAAILVLWTVVPVALFWIVGLWTYLTYYVILFPVHFLAVAVLADLALTKGAHTAVRAAVWIAVLVMVAANFVYMLDFYRFVGRYGGAHGTYGTVVSVKRAAARYTERQANVRQLMEGQRIVQMDQLGTAGPPQLEFPYLAIIDNPDRATQASTNLMVMVVDNNRANFAPLSLSQLAAMTKMAGVQLTNFGPMYVYFLKR